MKSKVSYLVSGGAGFIGSHFVDLLLTKPETGLVVVVDNFFLGNISNLKQAQTDPRLRLIKADASDLATMLGLIQEYEPDMYWNFATIPLPTSLNYPVWSTRVNVDLALVGCELARIFPHLKYVQVSTSEVYGSALHGVMNEEHPCNPETPYAASKLAADKILYSYQQTFGIKALVLRPFNNFGPRQNKSAYAGVIPNFIQKITLGDQPVINGDGEQTRDFIFVKDTVKAMYNCMLEQNAWGLGAINICSGKEVSINSLLSLIQEELGSTMDPIYEPERAGDVRRHKGDCSLYENLIRQRAAEELNVSGLRETISFYLSTID